MEKDLKTKSCQNCKFYIEGGLCGHNSHGGKKEPTFLCYHYREISFASDDIISSVKRALELIFCALNELSIVFEGEDFE